MIGKRLGKIGAVIAAALLISACSANISGQQEKIAVINWEQAVSAHPDYAKLAQGEKVLADLMSKRKGQEDLAKAQLGSLNKLRSLRHLSQQSYLDADFNTQMVAMRERENVKLQKFVHEVETQINADLAPRTKEIEDSYQLQIFNLRAVLETVKMKPDERKAVEEKLKQAQHERGQQIMELNAEKKRLLEAKVAPFKAEQEARMRAEAERLHADMGSRLAAPDERDSELLSAAPKALNNALSVMDREIEKQQQKNDELKKQINKDIESQAVRLAHERGYTIVFNKFKVNLKAEDITDAIVQALKKKK